MLFDFRSNFLCFGRIAFTSRLRSILRFRWFNRITCPSSNR